jgi:hypothetical protein
MAVTHLDSDSPLELAADLRSFFREPLVEALAQRRVEATAPTEHYLVALLVDFARPAELARETLDRPLLFLLEDALASTGKDRFERLRSLGDAVLYTSGFFLDHLATRGIELSYVSALGARAYGSAASMLRHAARNAGAEGQTAPELFEELAGKFPIFAQVIATVADGLFANAAHASDSSMLKVYERWLRTGSAQLASTLASRGMVATRGSGGVH